jgi:hypothetical protein
MRSSLDEKNEILYSDYAVIGAGPASIAAIIKLLNSGVAAHKIMWIDPQFKAGDFGALLSDGSSVPGNTNVGSYQKVYQAMYAAHPECKPIVDEESKFEITRLAPHVTCSIKIAAEPLHFLTEKLCHLVQVVKAKVSSIQETSSGIQLVMQRDHDKPLQGFTQKLILAIGAAPKKIKLTGTQLIDCNVAFTRSKLEEYLKARPEIKQVAVIGSSHSAALAVMHFLQMGIAVKQFMKKSYLFARTVIGANGTSHTQFDNTGLKGEVAVFTQQLLEDKKNSKGKLVALWQPNIYNGTLLPQDLVLCTHAVVAIGYEPTATLQINGLPLSAFKHDEYTTQMMRQDGRVLPGIFGIGIAFPLKVTALSGEVEFSVGVTKFWTNLSDKVLAGWKSASPEKKLVLSDYKKLVAVHADQVPPKEIVRRVPIASKL